MLYNIWCRWASACRVPPCAHRIAFCESVNLMAPSSHGNGVPFYLYDTGRFSVPQNKAVYSSFHKAKIVTPTIFFVWKEEVFCEKNKYIMAFFTIRCKNGEAILFIIAEKPKRQNSGKKVAICKLLWYDNRNCQRWWLYGAIASAAWVS